MLKGKRVLVTGATGFIGGRLVEKLVFEEGAEVVALVRNWSQCARLARLPVRMAKGSLTDPGQIREAMAGCDTVFHLAFDPTGLDGNIAGIRNLAAAMKETGARRLVHTSTISVYEPLPPGDITEDSPAVPVGQFYPDTKLAIEQEVLKLHREEGLPVVVVQPTIVYGPFCKPWTDGPAAQLLSGTVVLPDGGNGVCNAVYVDDVAHGMIRAAEAEGVEGRRYLISGPEPTTWGVFYGAMAEALGVDSIRYQPTAEIRKAAGNVATSVKLMVADPKRVLTIPGMRPIAMWAKSRLGDKAKESLKGVFGVYRRVAPRPVYVPDGPKLDLFSCEGSVRIDKAKAELGYAPSYGIAEGMALTADYLKWAYVPPKVA